MKFNKKSKQKKSGKRRGGDGASGKSIVPWDPNQSLTDGMRLPTSVSNTYRSIHTRVLTQFIAQSASVPQANTFQGVVQNLVSDYTSWASVFDQYRIHGLEIYLEPWSNSQLSTATLASGKLYTCIDYDDTIPLSSVAEAVAYDNCIVSQNYDRQRRCFRPRIAVAAYGSGAFTSYANAEAPWIDCSSGNVEHYGLKTFTDVGTAGALTVWHLTCRADIEFRGAR